MLTGVQVIPRLLGAQMRLDKARGLRTRAFVSGYPGSPLAGLDQAIARHLALAEEGISLVPGLNEELAATAVWGSQFGLPGSDVGQHAVGVWYGKSPGLDRAMDPIRHGNLVGADPLGGVLLLVGDDPACKSSSIPSASEATLAALPVPILYPHSSAELATFGLNAIEISRATGLWVAVKVVADVADGIWPVDASRFRPEVVIPTFTWANEPWSYQQGGHALPPSSLQSEADLLGPRWNAMRHIAEVNSFDSVEVDTPDAWLGIVASGPTLDQVIEALGSIGVSRSIAARVGVRMMRVGMPFPLSRTSLREFARGLETLLVIEDKGAYLEMHARDALYGVSGAPEIIGKRDRNGDLLVPSGSVATPSTLAAPLRRVLKARIDLPELPQTRLTLTPITAQRTPYLCSGCPHNRSTQVPEGSLAAGGIGCHGLVVRMPHLRAKMTGITQMGGEGAQWIGQSSLQETTHLFQNMGDGTYAHSGQLAIQACIASGVTITFKILYNGAIAMTGAQAIPGGLQVPELTRKLEAEGVARIIVCSEDPQSYGRRARWAPGVDVWHRDRLDEAQKVLREVPGVTVLIYDQACAAETRRLRKRGVIPQRPMRVLINEAVCEGCGDCGVKSNCLSVEPVDTPLGRKTQINQTTCNTDYSCLDGDCPSFVTFESSPASSSRESNPAPREVPDPSQPAYEDMYNIFFAGVGGTGVITVNRILAVAADLDGLYATGADQLGSSQKAGAVTSQLRISRQPASGSSLVPPGSADLFIAFDAIAAAGEKAIQAAGASRTHILVSETVTPTGEMVRDVNKQTVRLDDLMPRLTETAKSVSRLDAGGIAMSLFKSTEQANLVLLGAAFQMGRLPISAASIEGAIRLNGVAIQANIDAFRWGRVIVEEPKELDKVMPKSVESAPPSLERGRELLMASHLGGQVRQLAEVRAGALFSYGGRRTAERYVDALESVWNAERRLGDDTRLSEAVAIGLHRVMTYKDEYEVARLITSEEFSAALASAYPNAKRIRYKLQPPILRAMGMKRKIGVPPVALPLLRILAAGRVLRDTPLDPFGYTTVRRAERALRDVYLELVVTLARSLVSENYDVAVEAAAAVDIVRGYEHVKMRNLATFKDRLTSLGYGVAQRIPDVP